MDIKDISTDKFLEMSDEEKTKVKSEFKSYIDKLEELNMADNTKQLKEREEKLGYYFYKYDNFSVHNISNHLNLYGHPPEGFIVFLSNDEISELEWYGLQQLMINNSKEYDDFDMLISTYQATYYSNNDRLYTDKYVKFDNKLFAKLSINEVSKKLHYNIDLSKNMYAYCMYYYKQNRGQKSLFWRIFHRRIFNNCV